MQSRFVVFGGKNSKELLVYGIFFAKLGPAKIKCLFNSTAISLGAYKVLSFTLITLGKAPDLVLTLPVISLKTCQVRFELFLFFSSRSRKYFFLNFFFVFQILLHNFCRWFYFQLIWILGTLYIIFV